MDGFDKETLEVVRRLQNARLSLMTKQPFYAFLLLQMKFSLDKTCDTAYTDGVRIAFNPEYMAELSDRELEFVLMHNVLHAALGHPFRTQSDYNLEIYDMACDIVVNSNILESFNKDQRMISFKKYGVAPHTTPSGKEGYECTVEEVYAELIEVFPKGKKKKSSKASASGSADDGENGDGGKVAESINCDESAESGNDGKSADDGDAESSENTSSAMSDEPAKNSKTKKKSKGKGQVTPPGKADLEALIMSLKNQNQQLSQKYAQEILVTKKEAMEDTVVPTDDHSFWQGDTEDNYLREYWYSCTIQAVNFVMEKKEAHKGFGGPPVAATRLVHELTHPEVDWRTMLNEFVQEEVNDYSFSPPDRRMDDSPFFLPDFNEKDEKVRNVWFLIDTSGSISDGQIAAAYSEIVSAIDIFQSLEGLLSFTEVFVTDPVPFCSAEELLEIKPVGGGGNNFGEIFRYMQRNMMDDLPVSIVIFTDGYDIYPEEEEALGIPVLWLINNEEAEPPPWGKWARFKVNT